MRIRGLELVTPPGWKQKLARQVIWRRIKLGMGFGEALPCGWPDCTQGGVDCCTPYTLSAAPTEDAKP